VNDFASYSQENPVYALFEGICPNHIDQEVKVTQVGGTVAFLEEFGYNDDNYQANIWNEDQDFGDLVNGNITFTCPKGCVHVVAHNIYGDWNL